MWQRSRAYKCWTGCPPSSRAEVCRDGDELFSYATAVAQAQARMQARAQAQVQDSVR
ncbi:hypothetical protein ABCR94_24040 [Streptomyces sp. 21So2-11]|uniref:hypothetical protein n=1 Tax=Streptomyces sp. 21So2-11 TaxID=3144408 RepID=UPI00321A2289